MNKILIGLLLGAVLGIFDGLTAWFTPAVRDQMVEIVIGSTIKGMIAGIAAGWFARRVNSVPLGILFGFGIGLLLAFAVAAMPSPEGEHYYFEIMLPGSILGAVVGWATQRYGKPARPSAATRAAVVILVILVSAPGWADEKPISAAEAFDRLKSLSGEWTANMMKEDGPTTSVIYSVTAGGNTVMERQFAGTPHEMITMYHLDGRDLMATHYCHAGNQPRLRLNRESSSEDLLVFDFVGVSGLDTNEEHIHSARIILRDHGGVESEWGSMVGSEPGEPKRLFLRRKR